MIDSPSFAFDMPIRAAPAHGPPLKLSLGPAAASSWLLLCPFFPVHIAALALSVGFSSQALSLYSRHHILSLSFARPSARLGRTQGRPWHALAASPPEWSGSSCAASWPVRLIPWASGAEMRIDAIDVAMTQIWTTDRRLLLDRTPLTLPTHRSIPPARISAGMLVLDLQVIPCPPFLHLFVAALT